VDRIPAIRRVILADVTPLRGLGWSAAAVALPTALGLAIDQGRLGVPFLAYFPAALIAALLLGWRWASAVVALAVVAANWAFLGERFAFSFAALDALRAALFAVTCAALVWTGEMARRLVRQLEAAQAREGLLNHELAHRVKNMLATVSAMAVLTARHSGPDEFSAALSGRMRALQRATDLLAVGENAQCDLHRLIDNALAPFRSGGNFALDGPACELPRDACVPLSLALHELCTNATKYGALSAPDGRVELGWTRDGDGLLELTWREAGGPPVAPPAKVGMGTQLLRRQRGLKQVEVEFHPGGVECRIRIEGVVCGTARDKAA